jgi:hypothetical protein
MAQLRYYPGSCPEEPKKTPKNLSGYSTPRPRFERAPPKQKFGALPVHQPVQLQTLDIVIRNNNNNNNNNNKGKR